MSAAEEIWRRSAEAAQVADFAAAMADMDRALRVLEGTPPAGVEVTALGNRQRTFIPAPRPELCPFDPVTQPEQAFWWLVGAGLIPHPPSPPGRFPVPPAPLAYERDGQPIPVPAPPPPPPPDRPPYRCPGGCGWLFRESPSAISARSSPGAPSACPNCGYKFPSEYKPPPPDPDEALLAHLELVTGIRIPHPGQAAEPEPHCSHGQPLNLCRAADRPARRRNGDVLGSRSGWPALMIATGVALILGVRFDQGWFIVVAGVLAVLAFWRAR